MAGGNHSVEHTNLVNGTVIALTERYKDARFFKRNVGADSQTFHLFGTPGEGDIFGILAPNGRSIWLEAKTGKGKQSERQKSFQATVEKYGGQYHVFRSVEDAISIVKNAHR